MIWYSRLYTGEKAGKHRRSLIQKFRKKTPPSSLYLLVPAANERNLLDIYPASDFLALEEREEGRESENERIILGIALGYQEALALAGEMVDEVYQATGGFAVREYWGI